MKSKKLITTIVLYILIFSVSIFQVSIINVFAETNPGFLIELIEGLESNFADFYNRPLTNTDELIAYANKRFKGGDALVMWDGVYDNDGIPHNTISINRYLAVDNYILFQSELDAKNLTDTLLIFNMSENTLVPYTDRSSIFDIIDQIDKKRNDGILEDESGNSVSKKTFINTPSIKISLKNDRFQLVGIKKVNGKKIAVNKVIISKTSLSLRQDQQYQLAATVIPYNATNQDIKWSSSNSSVASVDNNGTVTGIKFGNAKIIATADGQKKAICNVNVARPANSYKVGQTAQLYCAAAYGTLTWTSSDTSIVQIIGSSGQYCTIKCLKEGTATVTIYVHSSDLYYDPEYKIFKKLPKVEDYARINVTVYK